MTPRRGPSVMNKSDISASGLNKEMAALAKEAMSQIKGLELTEDQMDHLSAVMSAKLSADLEFRKKKRDEVSQEIVDEEQSYNNANDATSTGQQGGLSNAISNSQITGLKLTEKQINHLSAVMSAKLTANLEFRIKKKKVLDEMVTDISNELEKSPPRRNVLMDEQSYNNTNDATNMVGLRMGQLIEEKLSTKTIQRHSVDQRVQLENIIHYADDTLVIGNNKEDVLCSLSEIEDQILDYQAKRSKTMRP